MGWTRRRTVLLAAGSAVLAIVLVAAWLLVLRGASAEDVAEDYLAATWEGDWATECELAGEQWRNYLFDGYPFASCADYATAAVKADRDGGFDEFRADTDVTITVAKAGSGGGRARVGYVVEFAYHGDDRDGFDALWQGGGALDRGTIELVDVDGTWRVAGVDGG